MNCVLSVVLILSPLDWIHPKWAPFRIFPKPEISDYRTHFSIHWASLTHPVVNGRMKGYPLLSLPEDNGGFPVALHLCLPDGHIPGRDKVHEGSPTIPGQPVPSRSNVNPQDFPFKTKGGGEENRIFSRPESEVGGLQNRSCLFPEGRFPYLETLPPKGAGGRSRDPHHRDDEGDQKSSSQDNDDHLFPHNPSRDRLQFFGCKRLSPNFYCIIWRRAMPMLSDNPHPLEPREMSRPRFSRHVCLSFLLLGLLLICGPSILLADSRSHRYYPSTSPQFASQLEIETVSLLFRNNNILVSDTRHTLIFMNASGLREIVPQASEGGRFQTIPVESGQAVVVAGNTHTAPVSTSVPGPALSAGLVPLSVAESGNLVYLADGSGRIEALNLTSEPQDVILIPDSRVRINAGAHISKLLKRSPTMGKLLGMATTLPLEPGYLSAIAGGGTQSLGSQPIDGLRARISPIALSANHDGLFIAGETGHILYLNNTTGPRPVPVREGRSLRQVIVRPGQIFLAASRDDESDPRPGSDPVPALASTMNPITIVASGNRLFTADQGGEIFEINLSQAPLPLPDNDGDGQPRVLDPGMAIRIAGGGTHLVQGTPLPALQAMLRPRSLAYDPQGILYTGDIETTLEAGRVLAINVSDHPILLPVMKHGTFRKVRLLPGKILSVAGNSRRQPVAPTEPTPAGDVGIEPVQLSYRNGLLAIGDLLGSIDLMNMTFRNRRAFPNDRQKSLILPPGTILSLMGNGFGSSEKPSDEVP